MSSQHRRPIRFSPVVHSAWKHLGVVMLLVLALLVSSSSVRAKCGGDWLWLWEPDVGVERPCTDAPCAVSVSAWHGELDGLVYQDESGAQWYIDLYEED